MADELNLESLFAEMVARIKAKFAGLKTVEEFALLQDRAIALPAVAIDLNAIDETEDEPGTEQFSCRLTFSAYCIVSYKVKDGRKPKVRAMSIATSLISFIKNETWGHPVSLAKRLSAYPDNFAPGDLSKEVWRVDWEHSALMGNSVWTDDGEPPTRVFLGISPLIGPEHEEHYREIKP
ncbi:MAG TPA: hypothetical protein VNQ90_02855 [Chthoniobacteraceae bacterium]|nr:hypothetical protein [Chthoniobacteraceae bacterium]